MFVVPFIDETESSLTDFGVVDIFLVNILFAYSDKKLSIYFVIVRFVTNCSF